MSAARYKRRKVVPLVAAFVAVLSLPPLHAQVITPVELSDIKAQRLQARHMKTLIAIGNEILAHNFPYPFYFTRSLDLDMSKMAGADQRSIRFDIYRHQTVLEVTGNYYASYSADTMGPYARLKETFERVVMPVLQVETPHFPDDSEFSAFAIEVSHHVRTKYMGLTSEHPENVTVVIPVAVAQKLVDAKTEDQRQQAILEAELFLNGEPYSLWLHEGQPSEEWKERYSPRASTELQRTALTAVSPGSSNSEGPQVSPALLKPAPTSARLLTPEALAVLQKHNQDAIDRITKSLDSQAHFVPYVPPAFIGFRQGAYLQISLNTSLDAAPSTSRYKLAALAFDEHVSHLIRPLLEFFPGDVDFDGIDFSSIIRLSDGSRTEAVEFFFPVRVMRCFAAYDCTGQQLLDSGTVVMNGERAKLDLEIAEGKN
jgi:hypothetical protein